MKRLFCSGLLFYLLLIAILLLSQPAPAHAQQGILNIPAADVMDKGKVFVRFDQSYQPSSAAYGLIPNLVIGVGSGIEAHVDLENFTHDQGEQPLAVAVGAKWRFYNGKRLALFAGDKVYFNTINKSYNQGNYFYAAEAYSIASFRFTAGAWNSQNVAQLGNHTGAMLGIERTIKVSGRLTITPAIDWQGGHGTNGYTTIGPMFMTKHWMIAPTYQLGNVGLRQGNHDTALYVGYWF